jgi:nucleotide-binding universal stress UspA family protein
MYPNILVSVDGSEIAMRGLEEALKIAKLGKSHLRLFQIVAEHVLDTGYCIGTYEGEVVERLRVNGRKVVSATEGLSREAGIETDTVLEEFDGRSVAAAILAQARDWPADLIVMGMHGRDGVRRLMMGSDAESVVRDASVPVLLVRAVS